MLRTIRRFGITVLIASSLNIASSLSNPQQAVATVVKLPDGSSQYSNSDRYKENFVKSKKHGVPPVFSAVGCEVKRKPQFPELLADQGIEARAIIELIIDESGKVTNRKLVESSGYFTIDRAAMVAASSVICPPQSSQRRVRIAINFVQEGSEREREAFERQAQAQLEQEHLELERQQQQENRSPLVSSTAGCELKRKPQFPELLTDQDIEARPVVELIIDESGKVTNRKLVESSGYPAIDQAALEIASSVRCPARGDRYRVRFAINFAQEGSEFEREALERLEQLEPERLEQQQEWERQQQQENESPPPIE